MQREAIDFLTVAPEHRDIDKRLLNWGRWAVSDGCYSACGSPMFLLYRSSDARGQAAEARIEPDGLDALDVEREVGKLPEAPREALRWHYCFPYISPGKTARYIGVRMRELPALVAEGRELLVAARV